RPIADVDYRSKTLAARKWTCARRPNGIGTPLLARLAGAGHASIIPAAGFPVARWTAALKQGGKRHGKRVMSMTSRPVDPPRVKQALRWLLPQSFLNWREKNYFHRHGEQEMHLVEFLCRRDQDAIDVGANYGGYVHFLRGH